MARIHILNEADDDLMRRWKGNGLSTYREHVIDEEWKMIFVHGQFALEVESAIGGVPIFTDDDRALLSMYLDELEAQPQAVRM